MLYDLLFHSVWPTSVARLTGSFIDILVCEGLWKQLGNSSNGWDVQSAHPHLLLQHRYYMCAFLAIVPNSITSWDFTNIEPTKKVATCNVDWHKDTKLHCALLSYVQNPSISSMGVMRLTCHPSGSAIIAAITTILFWIHVTQLWEQALVLVVCVG